jgi:hypothetical protein
VFWPARGSGWKDGGMHTDDPVLDLMDRFTAALNFMTLMPSWRWLPTTSSSSPPRRHPTAPAVKAGTRCAGSGDSCWRPQARFSVEEQFSDGSGRAVVRWRYDWEGGHVRGVDIVRVRHGQLAESLAYVKG